MMNLLAFWQFASGTMLLWAAAATAPILIHLFTRHRYRQVTWAAMEYLLAAVQKNRRRLQVEHWLLLAVRTLLMLLFALALADPVLSSLNSVFFSAAAVPTHHLFVLDGSYSMDYRREGVSRIEAAKEAIRAKVRQAAQGDGFSLLLLADPPRVVIGEPAFDPNDLLEELENLELTSGSADAQAILAELEPLITTGRKLHSRLTAAEITFVGDLERTTWESLTTSAAGKRCEKLAELAQLTLIDVGAENTANSAVMQLEVRDLPVTIDREFTVQAEIAQFGAGANEKRLATFVVDNEAVAQQSVELKAGGVGNVAFRHRFAAAGDHTVEIRLSNDALPIDDQRFLSVPVRESLQALCVYGRPGETQYLAAALAPEKSRSARVRVEEVNESALAERSLHNYDALFLVNLPKLDVGQTQILADYVRQGGGLVIFPGDQYVAGEFLPVAEQGVDSAFLPVKLGAISAVGDYRIDPLEYRHELIEPFRGFERAGLLTTPVWKYVRLLPVQRDDVRIALEFIPKEPAIVSGRFGQGRVVVFATAASPHSVDPTTNPPTPWTAFPTWPSFPPLVQETLSFVARSRDKVRNVLVNEEIGASLTSALPDTTITIASPPANSLTATSANAPRRVPLESKGDAWRWSFGDTRHIGMYEVRYGKPIDRTEQYAVNLEPRESALERIDSTRLPDQLLREGREETNHSPGAKASATGQAWFRSLLMFVLLLLATESWLAYRFSGGGT